MWVLKRWLVLRRGFGKEEGNSWHILKEGWLIERDSETIEA